MGMKGTGPRIFWQGWEVSWMRYLMAFFVLFALIVTGTPVEAQAPSSTPWDPVATWLEDLMAPAASGQPSDQKVRDYYRQFLSSKSQREITEDQFINYWRYTGTQAQGGQFPQLSYSVASVTYNEARDQAHVTYRYRLFTADNPRTGSNDVVLENGMWKIVLSPEIVADIQKAPTTQSRPSPTPTSPSVGGMESEPAPITAQSPQPLPAQPPRYTPDVPRSIVEAVVTPISGPSVSETFYGVHARFESHSSAWGADLHYLTGNVPGETDDIWWGYITYRLDVPQGAIRLAGGYWGSNSYVSGGSATIGSPLVGIEGTGFLSSGISLESGAFYLPSITATCGSGCVVGIGNTGWMGYVGLRYTTPGNGFTITGGYNLWSFSGFSFSGISGGPTSASGPYLGVGIEF